MVHTATVWFTGFQCDAQFCGEAGRNLPVNRDGKTFQRASNAGVNFFLARVKCVQSCTRFCCKSELCRDFVFFGVIPKSFYLVNF